MKFTLDPENAAHKAEMRQWIADNLPASLRDRATSGFHPPKEDLRAWMRILARRGWIGRNWPKEYGGPGWDTTQVDMFVEERSEEHTSELQSLMRISYAVFCLKKKTKPDEPE